MPEDLLARFKELEAQGRGQLEAQRVPEDQVEILWSADLRYEGQSYELNTPVKRKDRLTRADVEEIVDLFHKLHYRIYAYGSVDEMVEFINLRVAAIGKVPGVSLAHEGKADGDAEFARKGSRPVHFPGQGFIDTGIYERSMLRPGHVVVGPALIEEIASTTVMTPSVKGTVDEYGNIIIPLS